MSDLIIVLNKQIEEKDREIAQLKEVIGSIWEQLDEKDTEIARLQQLGKMAGEEIRHLRACIVDQADWGLCKEEWIAETGLCTLSPTAILSSVQVTTSARVEPTLPKQYRLKRYRVKGLVLQGYYGWQDGQDYGGEWRDIPTEEE